MFAGTFVAVALGVTLVSATGLVIATGAEGRGPSRFGPDTVVVTADPRLEVPRPGARGGVAPDPYVQALDPAPPLPADVVDGLAMAGVAEVVGDRSLVADLLGGDGRPVTVASAETRAHGWASAFGFAIMQRRRELALLRLVGATSRQVRQMVLAETLLVTLLAIAVGWVGSMPAAGMLVAFLRRLEVAPAQFQVQFHPLSRFPGRCARPARPRRRSYRGPRSAAWS